MYQTCPFSVWRTEKCMRHASKKLLQRRNLDICNHSMVKTMGGSLCCIVWWCKSVSNCQFWFKTHSLIGIKKRFTARTSIERGTLLLLSGECQRQIPTQKESDILRNACKMQMPMDPILILTTDVSTIKYIYRSL